MGRGARGGAWWLSGVRAVLSGSPDHRPAGALGRQQLGGRDAAGQG